MAEMSAYDPAPVLKGRQVFHLRLGVMPAYTPMTMPLIRVISSALIASISPAR